MKVFIAGRTGVIGTRTVRALVADGHDVTAVARGPQKAALVVELGGTPSMVDLFDQAAVSAAVAGHEAVVNLATNIPPISRAMRPGAWTTNDRLRREASRHLVAAALEGGALRYVQESICFPYADRGDEWIDESAELAHTSVTASSADAERAAAEFADGVGEAVVLRFAQFYADDSTHTRAANRLARSYINPFVGPPDSFGSFIHAEDAADAVVAGLTIDVGVYNVSDDEPLTRREAGEVVADALGVGRVRSIPGARRLAPPLARTMVRSHRISNAALKATGWRPAHPSIRGSWPVTR